MSGVVRTRWLVRSGLLAALGAAIACVPLRGGWDVEAVRRAVPERAMFDDERLGDMVPFPALELGVASGVDAASLPEAVALVACRFSASAAIRVHTSGSGWSEGPGARALAALAVQLETLGLALKRVDEGPAEIEVLAFSSEGPELPEGLGDTLVECDVAPRAESGETVGVRGQIRRAEVRLRRSGRDAAGRLRVASDEAWTGALLHELGHALGFAGHPATGRSILVRDEHTLRARGRAVLRGDPLADPNLAALHGLQPGERLGLRRLRDADAHWVRALRSLDRRFRAAGSARVAVIASVGDREARWSLRYADGRRLELRFPGWPERLREGREIVAVPDRDTFAAIEALRRAGSPLDSINP